MATRGCLTDERKPWALNVQSAIVGWSGSGGPGLASLA